MALVLGLFFSSVNIWSQVEQPAINPTIVDENLRRLSVDDGLATYEACRILAHAPSKKVVRELFKIIEKSTSDSRKPQAPTIHARVPPSFVSAIMAVSRMIGDPPMTHLALKPSPEDRKKWLDWWAANKQFYEGDSDLPAPSPTSLRSRPVNDRVATELRRHTAEAEIPSQPLPHPKENNASLEKPITATEEGRQPQMAIGKPVPESLFAPVTTPHVRDLRRKILKPVREIKAWSDMIEQGDAMDEISKLRTAEAAGVLAELLFSETSEYFKVEVIDGNRQSSFSFQVMLFLHIMLENTPAPKNGGFYDQEDIPIWQGWWRINKDKLVFRDLEKPVPPLPQVK